MKYSLGYRYSHQRPLSGDERELLQTRLDSARKRRRISLSLAWLVPFVIVFALMSQFKWDGGIIFFIGISAFIGMVASPAWSVLAARNAKRRYRLLQASVDSTTIDVFQWLKPKNKTKPELDEEETEEEPQFEGDLLRIPETGLILNALQADKPIFPTTDAVAALPAPRPKPEA